MRAWFVLLGLAFVVAGCDREPSSTPDAALPALDAALPDLAGPTPDAAGVKCDPVGAPVLITTDAESLAIAVDETGVYFFNNNALPMGKIINASVLTCPLDGCGMSPRVLAERQSGPTALVLDRGYLYWSTTGIYGLGTISRCAIDGRQLEPEVFVTRVDPYSLARDATNLYWIEGGYGVERCGLTGCGGTPLMVATGGFSQTLSIASDGAHLVWPVEGQNGSIQVCLSGACTPSTLASGPNVGSDSQVAVDGTYTYWTEPYSGTVKRCATDGCNGQPTVLATGLDHPNALAVDRENVYFSLTPPMDPCGAILKCPVTGCNGPPTVLARSPEMIYPMALAVHGPWVYWSDYLGHAISKIEK